jgi:hypothetical protein
MTTICDTGKDYKLSSPYYAEATTFLKEKVKI